MWLLILGIIALIISVILSNYPEGEDRYEKATSASARRAAKIIKGFSIAAIVIGIIIMSVIIIPAGNRGVLLRFSAVQGTMTEGIHFVVPYVNRVVVMEVRTQKESAKASAASKDMQIVSTSVALNFHVDPSAVQKLYREVGTEYKDRVIDPAVQESMKMVTAQFTAEELIKQRAAVKTAVENDITKRLRAYHLVVEPAGLSITDFNFSNEFNTAIESKQVAQQESEKQRYVLSKAELERQTAITKARGASEAARLNAQALQANGGSKVLAREWIEKWDGHLPQVAGSGNYIIDLKSVMKDE